jgi:hypothetical protein
MDLRKREFPLFLPDVNDHGDKAGQEAFGSRSLSSPARKVRVRGCAAYIGDRPSTYMRWYKLNSAHSHPSAP